MSESVIALDIGGTKIYAARYDCETLGLESEFKCDTEALEGEDHVLGNIFKAFEAVNDDSAKLIGVAWPGPVDLKREVVIRAPNIEGFNDFPLAKELSQRFSLPCFIENDAKLFAFGEQRRGAAKGSNNVLGVIVGTGVGAGLVIDGEIYRGHDGFAGELGHSYFSPKNSEKLENYFAVQDVPLKDFAKFIFNCLLFYNPELVVIGGGLGLTVVQDNAELLKQEISSHLERIDFPLVFDLKFSELKNSGALGAAIYALGRLKIC